MTNPLTEFDRALLVKTLVEHDDVITAKRIDDYWCDADRADRTPREFLLLHLGMLVQIVSRLTGAKVEESRHGWPSC